MKRTKFFSLVLAVFLSCFNPSVIFSQENITGAPDFTLPSIEGVEHTLSQFQGKNPVLLVFFATWCPPCNREVPHLVEIENQYGGRGLKILAVNIAEPQETVERFIQEKEINYTVLLDRKGKVADQYHVTGIPANFLIDKQGEVVFEGHRPPENIEDVL